MTSEACESVRQKVRKIFSRAFPDREGRLFDRSYIDDIQGLICSALQKEMGKERAEKIAFHVSDWTEDAAFLVALHLFPENFTPEEIEIGLDLLCVHVPNHLAAAAKLMGNPVEDVWDLGIFETTEEED